MKRTGTTLRMSYVLADRDLASALTLGDLAEILGLITGTALGERCRDLRKPPYSYDLRCDVDDSGERRRYVYWLPPADRRTIKATDGFKAWRKGRS